MEVFIIIVLILAACFVGAWLATRQPKSSISAWHDNEADVTPPTRSLDATPGPRRTVELRTPARRTGATPTGQRRRRRDGGFYPAGYIGEYYDDEDLIDEILFAAEILAADALIDAVVEERGSLSIEAETSEPEVQEERKSEPVFVDEPVAINNDDSWGSDDSDSGGDDD